MSPTRLEWPLQFLPTRNSCTIPVTTPIATSMRNDLSENRVALRYLGLWVGTQAVSRPAVREAGGKGGRR